MPVAYPKLYPPRRRAKLPAAGFRAGDSGQ